MTTQLEQETTVTAGVTDDVVYVYSTVAKHLRRLRADKRATETSGGDDWGKFTIPADQFDPLRGFKRQGKPMSDEQRAASAARLAAARANRA